MVSEESGIETIEPELSQAVITIGFFVIFLRLRMNGESKRILMVKNEKNRKTIKTRNCSLDSSLFSLFLKYKSIVTPVAAIIATSKKTNQYFIPNEINRFDFNEP